MELMHHERPTNGKICVLDSSRGPDVVDFLAQIESGLSAAQLVKVASLLKPELECFSNMSRQHSFLTTSGGAPTWEAGQLLDLVYETAYTSQVDYE